MSRRRRIAGTPRQVGVWASSQEIENVRTCLYAVLRNSAIDELRRRSHFFDAGRDEEGEELPFAAVDTNRL